MRRNLPCKKSMVGIKVKNKFLTYIGIAAAFISSCNKGQDIVHYTGKTLNNPDYHHGQLTPVMGVHNIQVLRANREFPEAADGFGWTYNHAPMLAFWNNKFYLEYLSDSVGESVPPGHTLLMTSEDGCTWSKPYAAFPVYKIPDGTRKEGNPHVAHNLAAVYHQRMGFYVSSSDHLLILAYIGISFDAHDSPNDGNGIGRVVREIYSNGSLGPIYFIRYNKGWGAANTSFPFYRESNDTAFVRACNELLDKPLMMQQWVEEADRDDPLIPLKQQYKALSYYHLPDKRVVGLWKEGLTSISNDDGKTWPTPVRAPGIVTANAKIWGQKTSDGKYALIYNPSDFRWPLAISVSNNGLEYTSLWLLHGEITTMRYGGNYKEYGPQYVRGILEGNGTPPDGKIWITYSVNKEDIWVSSVPVPVTAKAETNANDDFDAMESGNELKEWNIYCPLWALVKIEKADGKRVLALRDKDESDYAKAERLFLASEKVEVEFKIKTAQANFGTLHIELQDASGAAALRLIFDKDGYLKMKAGYRLKNILKYEAGKEYDIRIVAATSDRSYTVFVNDEKGVNGLFFASVHSLERVVFRTGEVRRFPDTDTPADQDFDVPQAGRPLPEAAFFISSLRTKTLKPE
ncbi:MAG: hypothetical protein ABSA76_08835 [Bacteroidales bacterium]